jgi:hypothetical protein
MERAVLDESKLDGALVALRDAGLDEPRHAEIDARCRAAIQREIRREQRSGRSGAARRRVPPRLAIALTALVTGSIGAVAYATLSSPEKLSAGIECHVDGSLDGGGAVISAGGRSPVEACRQLWADGTLDARAHAAPAQLRACVDPKGGGAIHVFPSADPAACDRVGLKDAPGAGTGPDARQYGRFSEALLSMLNRVECPTAGQVRAMVEDSLRVAGLTDWTIRDAGGYGADRPCASVALDSDARVVSISPIGR